MNPQHTLGTKNLLEVSNLLLNIPARIGKIGRELAGQRQARHKLEREIAAREVVIRAQALKDKAYKDCRNKPERETYIEAAKHADPEWQKMLKRLRQISVAIDKSKLEEEVLGHERESLRVVLEWEFTNIVLGILYDSALSDESGMVA